MVLSIITSCGKECPEEDYDGQSWDLETTQDNPFTYSQGVASWTVRGEWVNHTTGASGDCDEIYVHYFLSGGHSYRCRAHIPLSVGRNDFTIITYDSGDDCGVCWDYNVTYLPF